MSSSSSSAGRSLYQQIDDLKRRVEYLEEIVQDLIEDEHAWEEEELPDDEVCSGECEATQPLSEGWH